MTHPYASLSYAQSITRDGTPFAVPEWGCAVMSREIEIDLIDATGTYPMTVLSPSADLAGGLERLRQAKFVSIVIVLDDYHRPTLPELDRNFDFVRPFKTHYVVDREIGDVFPSRHHRYEIKKALSAVNARGFDLFDELEQWVGLYQHLSKRHRLQGVHDLPRRHHEMLSVLPGVRAVGAFLEDELLAAHLWVEDGVHVHSHLAASSPQGYAVGAAYAVNDASIRLFANSKIINLGGGAGYEDNPADGLVRFKMGFVNATARSYLCGKILDKVNYARLSAANTATSTFFPAYRAKVRPDIGEI